MGPHRPNLIAVNIASVLRLAAGLVLGDARRTGGDAKGVHHANQMSSKTDVAGRRIDAGADGGGRRGQR
jgi:hypothetical protein